VVVHDIVIRSGTLSSFVVRFSLAERKTNNVESSSTLLPQAKNGFDAATT
jgi:hypothetical protein